MSDRIYQAADNLMRDIVMLMTTAIDLCDSRDAKRDLSWAISNVIAAKDNEAREHRSDTWTHQE